MTLQKCLPFLFLSTVLATAVGSSVLAGDDTGSAFGEWHTGRKLAWSTKQYLNVLNDMAIGNDGYAYAAADNGTLFVSSDRGEHWQEEHVPVSGIGILNKVYVNDAGAVLVVRNAGQYAWSRNHGRSNTWTISTLEPDQRVTEVGFAASGTDVIWMLLLTDRSEQRKPGKLVLRTTDDGGKSWNSDIPSEVLFDRLLPIDSQRGWARHGSDLSFTEDGGHHWSKLTSAELAPEETIVKTQLIGDAVVLISNSGRVLEYSRSAGWISLPSIPAHSKLSMVSFVGPTAAYAVAAYNELWGAADIHGQWTPAGNLVGASSQLAIWAGPRVLIRSRDGPIKVYEPAMSREVVKVEAPAGEALQVALARNGHSVLTTSSGQVMSSKDSGGPWKVALSVPGAKIATVALAEDGWGVLVTGESAIWTTVSGGVDWQYLRHVEGSVARIAVAENHTAWIEVHAGPIWSGHFRAYRVVNDAWEEIPGQPQLSMIGFVKPDLLIGMDESGRLMMSTDVGKSWEELSDDIRNWQDSTKHDPLNCRGAFWSEDARDGWIACDGRGLFHTTDAGRTWRYVETGGPQSDVDYAAVHFVDRDYGIVYDDDRDDVYETSDGGDTWRLAGKLNWDRRLESLAFVHGAHGIVANKEATNFIKEIRAGLTVRAKVTPAGLRQLRVTVQAKDHLLRLADLKSLSVLARIGSGEAWLKVRQFSSSNGPEGLNVDFDPAQEDLRIEPGSWLATKVSFEAAGISHVATTPATHYQPWFSRNEAMILAVGTPVLLLVAIFALTGILYATTPRTILTILTHSVAAVDALKDAKLGFLTPIVELLVFGKWLRFLASRQRVVSAWLSAYAAGRCEFRELDDVALELFSRHDMFLDSWVSRQLKGYRPYFDAQLTSLKATQYVPAPVLATSRSGDHQFVPAPNALSIRELIEDGPMALEVVGRGGTGKTMLLGRIGIWAMEVDPNRRLLASSTAIPILIRKTTLNIVDHVILELKKGTAVPDANFFDPVLIKAALRTRRLIVLVDGLSELDGGTIDTVGNVFGTLPVTLLCFSARQAFPEIAPAYREINPQELDGKDLNRFVSQYIFLNRLRDKLSPLEELAISERLIELLQRRAFRTSLPALFVKLVLDTYDPRRDVGSGPFPVSLAEAVQRFVRHVKVPADAGVVEPEQLVEAATDVAVLCLGTELTPRAVDGELVRSTLSVARGEDASRLFKHLVDGNILISDVNAGGLTVTFSFDPVAEYLAAARAVKHLGLDERAWRQHLGQAMASASTARNASGYLEALLECIVWIKGDMPVPELIEHYVRLALKGDGPVDNAA